MANGAFKFKDNSGNVVAHISGSGTGIMVSGSALGLTGSVDVVGSLSVNGSAIISNSSQLTGSLDSRYVLSGSITQTTWDNIASKPSGIVSGSSQISGLGYAITGSNTFQGNQTINGNLIVTGSLTAQQFIVSSSVTYLTTSFASGSTKFGDDTGDSHNFTGSVFVTGSLRIPTASSTSNITGTAVGQLFFNTTDNNVYRYNGSSWLSAAGSSGTSGTSGSSGTAGTSGSSGSAGTSGSSGLTGANGTSGTSGSAGSSGTAGTSGTAGSSGSSGSAGTSGATGTPGSSGSSGSSGTAGTSGTSGSSGSSGSAGTSGAAIINNNTANYVLTATGTAGTIQGNSGLTFSSGTLTATTFSGALSGNATTATSTPYVTTTLTGTNEANLIYAPIADNDFFRLRVGGAAANSGWVELATADDGNEPIYVRQYTGAFATLTRTATLLDGSGNTIFPGNINGLTVSSGTITAGTWNGSTIGNAYLTNSSFNIGTTSISLGRASASQTLTGVSIDGNAGSVTYLSGRTDSAAYPVLWGAAYTNTIGTIAYSCAAVTIQSSTGTLTATTFVGALTGNASTATTAASCSGNAATATSATNAATVASLTPTQFFNNMGDSHGTRTSFDASAPSYNFGFRYVQGSTNAPAGGGGTQFYSWYLGLGNDYAATGAGSYGMYVAIPRNATTPYMSVRYNENNGLGSWIKIAAGYADTAGSATTAGNITAYTINQSVGTGNAPTFAGGTINGSLYVNANNDITTLAGSLTLYSTGNATTSMMMFKNTTGLGYGNHGAITGTYNTYFVMDTTDRGWVWRNATTSTNIASISNTGTFTVNGNVMPTTNNSSNLGSASVGWANVYTNDLHLSNMNKPEGNDVDGTNGTWTIQEGSENLYIINNNNGKKFKISLEEVK